MVQKNPIVVGDGTHTELVAQLNGFKRYWFGLHPSNIALAGCGVGMLGMMAYCAHSALSASSSFFASAYWGAFSATVIFSGFIGWWGAALMVETKQDTIKKIRTHIEQLCAQDPSLEPVLSQVNQNLDGASIWWQEHVEGVLAKYTQHTIPVAGEDSAERTVPNASQRVKL